MGRGVKIHISPGGNYGLAVKFPCDYGVIPSRRGKVQILQQPKKKAVLIHCAPQPLPLASLNDCNLQD
jgi:hypothetical protein